VVPATRPTEGGGTTEPEPNGVCWGAAAGYLSASGSVCICASRGNTPNPLRASDIACPAAVFYRLHVFRT